MEGSGEQNNNPLGGDNSTQALFSEGVHFSSEVEGELRRAFVNDSSLPKSVVDHNIVKSIIKGILEHEKFKKYIDKELTQICEQSVKQAKEVTDKHIKDAVSCAYFTKGDKGLDVLNVHLYKQSSNKTIPISDVLGTEKEVVSELNIYGSSGEREVNAKRNKEVGTRNYHFEEGANYLITVNWPIRINNKSSVFLAVCSVVVIVNNGDITGVEGFKVDGIEISLEHLSKLAAQNKEVLINGYPFPEVLERAFGLRASESLVPVNQNMEVPLTKFNGTNAKSPSLGE